MNLWNLLKSFYKPGSGVTARPAGTAKHAAGRMARGVKPARLARPRSRAGVSPVYRYMLKVRRQAKRNQGIFR